MSGNASKRPWSATLSKSSAFNGIEVVDLTSDTEDNPPKRQKSPSPRSLNTVPHKFISSRGLTDRSLVHGSWRKNHVSSMATADQVVNGLENASAGLSSKRKVESSQQLHASPVVINLDKETKHRKANSNIVDLQSLTLDPISQRTPAPNFELKVRPRIMFDPTIIPQSAQQPVTKHVASRVDNLSKQVQPSQSVQVNIPKRPNTDSNQTRLPQLDEQLNKPVNAGPRRLTPPKQTIQVKVPPTPLILRINQKEIFERLKNGIEYIQEHADEVHEVMGHTGFASPYPTDLDARLYSQAAQHKQKKVKRPKVKLELERAQVNHRTTRTLVHPQAQVSSVLTDRFADESITFVNDIDDKRLHGKFQFVSDYILSKGVEKRGFKVDDGGRMCRCPEGQCDTQCACFLRRYEDVYGTGESLVQTYKRRADGRIVLSSDFIDNWSKRTEITECNVKCACSYDCMNRVVQRGRQIRLEIFQTKDRGFGVRSPDEIVRGQFIELYLGEVLTEKELYRREQAVDEGTPSYVYSLDWFYKDSQAFHVDGGHFGSAMRFVNHSCNPNARTFTITNPSGNQRLHYLGFFAIKDIDAGTEITIDYNPGAILDKLGDVEDDSEVVRCKCGESNCRKRLWQPGKARGRPRKAVGHELD